MNKKLIEEINWIRHHATDKEIAEILGKSDNHDFFDNRVEIGTEEDLGDET